MICRTFIITFYASILSSRGIEQVGTSLILSAAPINSPAMSFFLFPFLFFSVFEIN